MSKRVFVTADNHFGHVKICEFERKDGTGKIRPYDSLDDMHRDFIERWNSTVGTDDLVYCLGDFALGKRTETVAFAEQLNGEKILVMGNHDTAHASLYLKYFKDLKACEIYEKNGVILTHIPVHERQFDRWKLNVHGHLHHDSVTKWVVKEPDYDDVGLGSLEVLDPRYVCVSVEQTDFKPILLDTVLKKAGIV